MLQNQSRPEARVKFLAFSPSTKPYLAAPAIAARFDFNMIYGSVRYELEGTTGSMCVAGETALLVPLMANPFRRRK
jgi:hypothetical protein